jgi:regulator of replication initiation timing
MGIREIASEAELEMMVMNFIDVLDRTRAVNTHAMNMVEENARYSLEKDNEVLLDLRNRLWRQFQPLFTADRIN